MTEDECPCQGAGIHGLFSDFSERTELNKHDCQFSFSSLQSCQYILFPLESRSKAASFSARPGVLVAGIAQFLSLHLFYLVIPPLLGIPTACPKLVKGGKTTDYS